MAVNDFRNVWHVLQKKIEKTTVLIDATRDEEANKFPRENG